MDSPNASLSRGCAAPSSSHTTIQKCEHVRNSVSDRNQQLFSVPLCWRISGRRPCVCVVVKMIYADYGADWQCCFRIPGESQANASSLCLVCCFCPTGVAQSTWEALTTHFLCLGSNTWYFTLSCWPNTSPSAFEHLSSNRM